MDALQRNLLAAHTALTMQSNENALQASIAAKNSDLASRTLMARMEELAADGARTTGVLMRLITHVPNLATIINGDGLETLNPTATAMPDSENPAVIVVAEELSAGKRGREGADGAPEESAREEEEEGIRKAIEEDVEKLRQLQLIVKPAMEAMEVDPVEGEVGGGGELLQIGILYTVQWKRVEIHLALATVGTPTTTGV